MATEYIVVIEGQKIPIPAEIGDSDDKVKMALTPFFPDAANAMLTRVTKGDVVTINVVKRAGAKGMNALTALEACPGGKNPAIELYEEMRKITAWNLGTEMLLSIDARIEKAIDAGEKQTEQMEKSMQRLSAARALPAPLVVVGF